MFPKFDLNEHYWEQTDSAYATDGLLYILPSPSIYITTIETLILYAFA